MKIEAGKTYRSRDGQKVGPMEKSNAPGVMEFRSHAGWWAVFEETGRCNEHDEPDLSGDLVAEWIDAPEWAQQVEAEAAQEATPDIKATIADEAKRIVLGARRSAYGKPEQNFERIARFWNVYLVNVGLLPVEALRDPDAHGISAKDVSPMMRLMKEARLCETPDHYDSFVDMVGYTLTGAEVNGVTKPA